MSAQPNTGSASRSLQDAFSVFNEISLQLAASYRELENRVAQLTGELAAARSERLLQLQEKERLAARLEGLLDALPGGVVVLDGERRVQSANPVAVELLGEPLLGLPWVEVCERSFVKGSEEARELTLHDGRRVSVSTRPMRAEPGHIVLLQDVTETRALQETVNQHKRLSAMGEMAAGLAHQIRTPLASALLYAGHLTSERLDDADRVRFAGKIRDRLQHLEHLVNDMLLFVRGAQQCTEQIDLPGVLDELHAVARPQLERHGAVLEVHAPAAIAPLHGNRAALLGAFLNLVTNAVQAGAGRITITVEGDAAQVRLRFADDGPGIPEAVAARIFEPFFTTRSEGTGLGLAVVRAVMHAHDGRIALERSAAGGAQFVLQLPCSGTGA